MLGTRSTPSSHATTTSARSPPPTSTSWTDASTVSGSTPRLKVRHAWGSRSTSSTRRPASAKAAPSEATEVVLATPPFWLARAMIVALRFGAIERAFRREHRDGADCPSPGHERVAPGEDEAPERLRGGQQPSVLDPRQPHLAARPLVGERDQPGRARRSSGPAAPAPGPPRPPARRRRNRAPSAGRRPRRRAAARTRRPGTAPPPARASATARSAARTAPPPPPPGPPRRGRRAGGRAARPAPGARAAPAATRSPAR